MNAIPTKVRKIGGSLGIIIPKEALSEMNVSEGSTVHLTAAAQRSVMITPDRPGFKEKMAIAEDLMGRYHNALRELAK
ncbi:MAG: AbrB/MazE/SpoVT family DNA-binding domain-containing protein [Verrucomicrobiota bacterium]